MDGRMDTVCLCRDPLLSTHSGWVKAFGFFYWKSKTCSASGEWGIGFPSPGILSNMCLRRYSCNGISSSDMSRAHHGFGVVIKVVA
ncbi:hypothetical protein MUK42_18836 [Musa troglodytarum]|uniref:Uncharacterized protein n=1 Tax=Musa troglodytarum TaxID=320322 RepID=A0A9E7EV04_9LILI|nr:hypothetical protein MUK42_18836 [Musa troglodytarum]